MSLAPRAVEVSRKHLTADQEAAYVAGQVRPHRVDTRVHLLDRDHNLLQDLSHLHLTGQTNFQAESVMRTASASFVDPYDEIGDGDGFGRKHMLQAWSLVTVEGLDVTVVEPMFCGPVTGKAQDGATVSVTCQDKAMLGLTDVPRHPWAPKTRAVLVIRQILEDIGETRIALPRGITERIDEWVVIGAEEEQYPITVIEEVADAIGYQFLYDAEGWARLRELPTESSHTYRTGVDVVGDEPSVSTSWADRPNRVLVRGGKGITATAELEPGHPDRPFQLGRGGALGSDERRPYRVTEIVENDKIRSEARAALVAGRRLRQVSRGYADVSFSALPERRSQPLDVQTLQTGQGSADFVLDEASLPWGPGEATVGYQEVVTKRPGKLRIRTTRKKKRKKGKGKKK